ncbi:eukaryotic translation initiation factor 4E transporter-like isoform X2 [Limulus polyphemus]|uniref:Eukaryotic translation initiation factor 4E transporter-like isoform X2 n=1 Tax=Limulus polyphemus TaxID=6850 RepID=A0ABM1TK23_LIMPO|nr:eukaryotic translation initiation factor 4E transporter-like isoform X2 [Limulus polyphemus]
MIVLCDSRIFESILLTQLRNIMAVVQQSMRLLHSNIIKEIEQQQLLSGGDKNRVPICYETSRPSSRGPVKSSMIPKPLPEYQYTKKELLQISKFPLAKKRPECLDPEFNNSFGLWNPLNWSSTIRHYEQSLREVLRLKCEKSCNTGVFYRRRTPAPKQRILNPQRKGFGASCRVSQQVSLSKRSGSPLEPKESLTTIPPKSSRRTGSVREVAHDKDQWGRDKDLHEKDYRYNKYIGERGYSFDQDNKENESLYSSQYGQFGEHGERFGRGRSDGYVPEEEPEWFVEGPASQSETVELVGMDEFKQEKKNKEGRQSKDSPEMMVTEEVQRESETVEVKTEEESESKQTSPSFDINELFKSDFLSKLIPNGILDEPLVSQGVASSRFSQWFQRDSPAHISLGSCSNSRRSSFQDELVAHVLCDALGIRDSVSPTSLKPLHGEDSFPSVSPVLPQNYGQERFIHQQLQQDGNKSILELLQVASINLGSYLNGESDKVKEYEKMRNVEELEADLKKLVFGQNREEEQGNNALNKLMEKMQACGSDLLSNLMRGDTPTPPLLPNVTPAITPSHIPSSTSPQLPLVECGDLMSLLKGGTSHSDMQNAQALIDEKQQTEFLSSLQKNPPQQQPQRSHVQSLEIPTVSSGLGPDQSSLPYTGQGHISPIVFGQQPPLSHAPAPIHPPQLSRNTSTLLVQPAPVLPRVPSPQELAVHTQSILQNALIKRKLEEQKKNFIQQQKAQGKSSTSVSSVMNKPATVRGTLPKRPSPTMAAFTPTSVMRKMQTEKNEKGRGSVKKTTQPDADTTKRNNTGPGITSVPTVTVNSDTTEPGLCPTQVQGNNIANGGECPKQQQKPTKGGVTTSNHTIPGPGRPIVKGSTGQGTAGDHFGRGGGRTVAQESAAKLIEQQCILQRQQAQAFLAVQRQLNTSLMPPTTFGMGPTGLNASLVRPGSFGLGPNLNLILLRNIVQNSLNNPNNRGPWSLNYLAYLLALQQQRGLDIRQLQALAHARGIHPLSYQQLQLLHSWNQAAMVSGTPNMNPMSTGGCYGNLASSGRPGLIPIQGPSNQQSPVNLAKWFGSDVLKQKMPDMPPVFQQRAYLAEELERQQLAATIKY